MNISRKSQSNVRKSNSIEAANLNPWTEIDWVAQSNQIEPNFVWVQFLNQLNKSNRTEFSPVDCVRLCSVSKFAGNKIILCSWSRKHEKHELCWSNSSLEKLVIDFQHQFYKKKSLEIKSSIWLDFPIIFVFVRFTPIASRTQSSI